ncbi:MAG: Rrf2 family transcriptional regulator [Stappiaceae bacterium]
MRLNQASDYALRIVMQCAMNSEAIMRIDDVVAAQNLSKAHVMKLVAQLGRVGILTTVRGRGGGFQLGRASNRISVGDVVRAVEADFSVVECMKDNTEINCCYSPSCALKPVMGAAVDAFMHVLDGTLISDTVGKMSKPVPFLTPEEQTLQKPLA